MLLSDVDEEFNAELESTYNKHNGPARSRSTAKPTTSAMATSSSPRSPAAPTPPTRRCWSPPAWSRARRGRKGLTSKPWVKTSLAPGSKVVTDYLDARGLSEDLNAIGFDLVGYGCTTCIGNSGPLAEPISQGDRRQRPRRRLSVLSGNRNFEGRVSPDCRANYLASPPLVVAYALKGTVRSDMVGEPIGIASNGEPVFLKDIWPTNDEVRSLIDQHVHSRHVPRAAMPTSTRATTAGAAIEVSGGETYAWPADSTYIQNPPYFDGMTMTPVPPADIADARALAMFGDSITTDHISPAGAIKLDSPAGKYLIEQGRAAADFNSYGARRGNHEVMMRGTFANIRIKQPHARRRRRRH